MTHSFPSLTDGESKLGVLKLQMLALKNQTNNSGSRERRRSQLCSKFKGGLYNKVITDEPVLKPCLKTNNPLNLVFLGKVRNSYSGPNTQSLQIKNLVSGIREVRRSV